ncbi:hypothetical protein [Micromonospora sp. NPDC023888]|uniref:hypothetical protein n=1 Tax=Micromonospora sp. NPDC023888 TaxID=3155607 RepID=UPI0033F7E7AF
MSHHHVMASMNGLGFCYAACPGIFLGRQECGPLNIVWDTNILIDYQQHGLTLWDDEEVNVPHGKYRNDVVALGGLIDAWSMRDISFHIFPRTIDDAKKRLTESRRIERERAIAQIVQALCLESGRRWAEGGDFRSWYQGDRAGIPREIPGQLSLFSDEVTTSAETVLDQLPEGADRELVHQAVSNRFHVFLTRDAGVLRVQPELARFGLLTLSPAALIEKFDEYRISAFGGGLRDHPGCPYQFGSLTNDLQRMSHLIQALDAHRPAP